MQGEAQCLEEGDVRFLPPCPLHHMPWGAIRGWGHLPSGRAFPSPCCTAPAVELGKNGPEGCCPGGQRRLSLCPRTWLCTLCWGSGEQSCLLTIVGGNPWAVIPLGAGWDVQGTAATLGLTAVSQKPRASPVLAALSWPLRCGTSGAQAGGKSSWKPEGEEMGAPAEVHHGTYQRAIWTRKCLWPAGWKCLCQQDYSPGTMGSRSPTA